MSLEEFYTVTIDGEETTMPKLSILNRGLTKLGLSQSGTNAFNYITLKESYKNEGTLPSEEVLKAKGVEQLEHEATLPTLAELKASAKAKLIAGESLTSDEANTIVI